MVSSQEDLLTIKSAAELLGISEVTLRRWDQAGKLRAHRHPGNGYRLYRRAEVEALVGKPSDDAGQPPPFAAPVGSFVGRAGALAELDEAFARGARLVTVVGPPGVGKTRLAIRHAELLAGAAPLPGGAWFCDATGLRDARSLRSTLVGLFGLLVADPSSEILVAALARRRSLLLLVDNAEDLDADARRVLPTLLARVPPLRLLVTSREPLGVEGEALVELAPLALPASGVGRDAVLASEAVALLLARARSARSLAQYPDELAALVRALDGLPLAIELAASLVGVLSPGDVLARFGPLLDGAPSGARAARHDSLRAAIDTSWQMLDDAGRSALAQCSLFLAGFTLEAAEHVVAGPPGADPLTLVRELCGRSLISVKPGASAGEERMALLESIRVFALEHLDPATRAAAEERHTRYYLSRAEGWAAAVRTQGDVAARRRLAQESANLRGVLARRFAQARAGEPAAAVDALRAVLCLDAPLSQQGRYAELIALLDEVEALARAAAAPEPLLIQAALIRGEALGWAGQLARSVEVLEDAVARAVAIGDAVLESEGRTYHALRLHQAGRIDEAIAACERSPALRSEGGSRRLEGLTRIMRGVSRGNLGQSAEARADVEAGRQIVAELGDRWSEGIALAKLAHLEQEAGRFEETRFYYEACLRCLRESGDIVFEAVCQCFFATLVHEEALAGAEGAADEARRAYEAGLQVLDAVRLPYFEGLFRGFYGALEAALGAPEQALEAFDRAAVRLGKVGRPAYLATLDVLRGALERRRASQGDGEAARALAERLRRGQPFAAQSMHMRTALRMLADRGPAEPTQLGTWKVGPESRWLATPQGAALSLGRRGAVRRVLEALVVRRLAAPGAGTTADALVEAGWPGEKIQHEAGLYRVRTAIAELRALGLRDLLLTRDDGYLLDPVVPLARAERAGP